MANPSDYDLLPFLRAREAAILGKIDRRPRRQCWLWMGAQTRNGYGTISLRIDGRNRSVRAHRAVFMLTHDRPIVEALTLHHRCHNLICVNPAHLVEMTFDENSRRRSPLEGLRYAVVGHG